MYVLQRLQQVSRCLQQNPAGIIGCCKSCGMSLDISSRSPGVSSRIQEVSLDVANLMVCLWMSPAGLQVSPAESRRYHWMSRSSCYVGGCLPQLSRCLQQNPGCIIGCTEHWDMSCKGSSKSPGVSSGIQEVSLDVANLMVCLWTSPAGLQVPPAESRRYHWMSRTLWYVSGCVQQVSSCLQRNPGGIIWCSKHRHMSCKGSSESPGVSRRIPELSSDVANLAVCLWASPAGLGVSPAESRRYHWMSRTLWYVSGCLWQVSRCLQWNPGGIIWCSKHRHMSCKGSRESPGLSRWIQEVSLDVANLVVHLWMSLAGLQVPPAESKRYHWM